LCVVKLIYKSTEFFRKKQAPVDNFLSP